jgi:hypothetical protein
VVISDISFLHSLGNISESKNCFSKASREIGLSNFLDIAGEMDWPHFALEGCFSLTLGDSKTGKGGLVFHR